MKDKEKLSIPRFDGVFGIADSKDLPPGVAYYAENIDFVTRDGSFVGFPEDEAYGGSAVAKSDEIVLYNDGLTATLYNEDTGDFRVITFSHTGKTVATLLTTAIGTGLQTSMVSSGQAVHMGLGGTSSTKSKRIGVHYHPQFGVVATTVPNMENAELSGASVGWPRNSIFGSNVIFHLPDNKHNGGFDRYARFDNTQARFRVNVDYTWYASLVYDGNQEAPLQKVLKIDVREAGAYLYNGNPEQSLGVGLNIRHTLKITSAQTGDVYSTSGVPATDWWQMFGTAPSNAASEPAIGVKEITFTLRVRTTDNSGGSLPTVGRRVSGVKLYRSEAFSEDGKLIEAEPRYINYYDLNTKAGIYTWAPRTVASEDASTEYFDTNGVYQELLIVDPGLPGTYTFEDSADYAASLSHMEINYGLSCMAGGYHIIGQAWHRDLEDINTWVFRSKPYRYDTYDWVNDYLVLPSKPSALVSYRGSVFAFTKGRIYVINPSVFDIEETWEGAGVEHEKSVMITESGMFWASNTGIYHYDSARVNNIGTPILRLKRPLTPGSSGGEVQDIGWLDRNSVVPVVTYSPVHDSLIVFYSAGSGNRQEYLGLLYHVPTARWVPISNMGAEVVNAHVNDNGDIIVGFENNVFKRLFTSANRRKWRFVSRNLGDHGSVHKYYHAYMGTSIEENPPTLYFYVNDPLYRDQIPVERGQTYRQHSHLYKYRLTETPTSEWIEARDFAIEITDTAGNIDATEITIIRKRLSPR